MADLTVKKLAEIVGFSSGKLLSRMKEASLKHASEDEIVTDKDRKKLLEHLKNPKFKKTSTISLKKKTKEKEVSQVSNKIEIQRKNKIKTTSSVDKSDDSDSIDFKSAEAKRKANEQEKANAKEKVDKKVDLLGKTKVRRTSKKDESATSKKIPVDTKKDSSSRISKREERELEGERILELKSKSSEQHKFEKPAEFIQKKIQIPESISVADLAQLLSIKGGELLKKLMSLGVMATINQTLDQDTAILITEELGHLGEIASEVFEEDKLQELVSYSGKESSRTPVVSVLGHVDHGKTTLLDFIRSAKVASSEDGGITQKIGAYKAQTKSGEITFIDTPGHAAFTEIRARGANSTDIVVLVVAADDGVQPQTEEAVNHAKVAGVTIIVAVNKIDTDGADLEKIKKELSELDLVPEDWGGNTQFIPVSALTGEGVDNLLEAIALEAEVLELKTFFKGSATGIVLDSSTQKGQGAIATLLVQKGTLKLGDIILLGEQTKKVRTLIDENNKKVEFAEPSSPVIVTGLETPPIAGEDFIVVSSEKMAKDISQERAERSRLNRLSRQQISNVDAFFELNDKSKILINLLIKADTHGSLEAIVGSIGNFQSEETKINIIHKSVGGINENDINLARTADAYVIGFNVRADNAAKNIAENESIDIKLFSIIYDLLDSIKELIEGKLEPEIKENILGTAEVRDLFTSPKFGLIAGSMVIEGSIKRNSPLRVIRDNIVIFEGKLDSLRRFKDDASEVKTGMECGLGITNYKDVKVGDKIEVFERLEVKRTLSA
jgi:translation initiation factor IF-2